MNFFEKFYSKFFDKAYLNQKTSYSQCGEDLIVDFLLTWVLKITNPTYLDIGAHHPFNLNNTYLFYKRGERGVSIEPDPDLFLKIAKYRPYDVNINKGVGVTDGHQSTDFYIMSSRTLNTFSKTEAERMNKSGNIKIDSVKKIDLVHINEIIAQYFELRPLDFLSIDVEGWDLQILKSLDFNKCRPNVICVETIIFNEGRKIEKQQATIDFLLSKEYVVYADTSINSIFVRAELLQFL
jgi:FkbM family methyltransferase